MILVSLGSLVELGRIELPIHCEILQSLEVERVLAFDSPKLHPENLFITVYNFSLDEMKTTTTG